MKMRSVFVNGRRYSVRERPDGSLRAHLFGIRGWVSVWADDYTQLVRRIRFALESR
jgi:hypothetical protein